MPRAQRAGRVRPLSLVALSDASASPSAVASASSDASSRLAAIVTEAHATAPAGRSPHGLRSADTISAARPQVTTRAYRRPSAAVTQNIDRMSSTKPYGPNVKMT